MIQRIKSDSANVSDSITIDANCDFVTLDCIEENSRRQMLCLRARAMFMKINQALLLHWCEWNACSCISLHKGILDIAMRRLGKGVEIMNELFWCGAEAK